jgi:hypothetical protein
LGAVLLFFLELPLLLRVSAAYTKAERACINIYEQQYQMGRFLQKYYPEEGVAANDIGAVAYFTTGRVVDLWGLGDIDIARSRRKQYWTPTFLDTISRRKNARLAIVYDSWFKDSLQHHWQKLATWKIPDNVVCGDDIVSFYAIDSSIAPKLKNDLILYQQSLPKEVEVKYY